MYYPLVQDEISFLSIIPKKEIKTHLVFDCLSKFTFGQGINIDLSTKAKIYIITNIPKRQYS